eukprot:1564497-Rhodomonas_salina.2
MRTARNIVAHQHLQSLLPEQTVLLRSLQPRKSAVWPGFPAAPARSGVLPASPDCALIPSA